MSDGRATPDRVWCPTCGIVRDVDLPAWCRHNALDVPATPMVPIPVYHPLADEATRS